MIRNKNKFTLYTPECDLYYTHSGYWNGKFVFTSDTVKTLLCEFLHCKPDNLNVVIEIVKRRNNVTLTWIINTALIKKYGIHLVTKE